jgi:diguanylate cyclase (GGDEF)-like protein
MPGAKAKLAPITQQKWCHILVVDADAQIRQKLSETLKAHRCELIFEESSDSFEKVKFRLGARRIWIRAIQGAILSVGAPLGWLVVRSFSGVHPWTELIAFPGLYLYMLTTTMIAFAIFGGFVGLREERLKETSVTDPVTGLKNIRYFLARLEEASAESQRLGQPLAVAVVDFDSFKSVNDSYGHPVGDIVLAETAQSMTSVVRRADTVARMGGEEFALILPGKTGEEAKSVGERVRRAICQTSVPLPDGRGEVKVTASVGVASTAELAGAGLDALYAAADAALYRAKGEGRNRVVLARPDQ